MKSQDFRSSWRPRSAPLRSLAQLSGSGIAWLSSEAQAGSGSAAQWLRGQELPRTWFWPWLWFWIGFGLALDLDLALDFDFGFGFDSGFGFDLDLALA